MGTFYRKPVVLTPDLPRDMPAADDDTLLDLLMRDDLPAGMRLRTVEGEWIPTDARGAGELDQGVVGRAGLTARTVSSRRRWPRCSQLRVPLSPL
jgi:hypothetical protein